MKKILTCVLRAPTLLLRVSSHHGPLTGTGRVSCPLPAFVALAAGPERVTEAARSSERERAQRGRAHEPSVNKADKSSPCVNRQPSPVQSACVLDTQGPRGGLSRGPERGPAAIDGIPAAAPSFAGAGRARGAPEPRSRRSGAAPPPSATAVQECDPYRSGFVPRNPAAQFGRAPPPSIGLRRQHGGGSALGDRGRREMRGCSGFCGECGMAFFSSVVIIARLVV